MSELASIKTETPQESTEVMEMSTDKIPLRFITCGSVDDGKSTLIGRLLWDTKVVPDDIAANSHAGRDSDNSELSLPDFANLLDGLQAEREQGITIDVAYRYFSTQKRSFIVADTPGHKQYTRNMATGASTADLAVLLVDARAGILEQTRRHLNIVSLMGIKQVILAINKIDLIDYNQERYDEIISEFNTLSKPLGFSSITTIPTSAINGENVVSQGSEALSWYEGPTLLEALELASKRSVQSIGFRLSVQRVSRPDETFRGYQGTVSGGSIKPGDEVIILPSGERANVSQILTFDLVRNAAVTGDAVTLVLDRQVDISRGDMIISVGGQPETGYAFDSKLIVLNDNGLNADKRYWLKSASRRQKVRIQAEEVLDLNQGEWLASKDLSVNKIAKVRLKFDDIAFFDPYQSNRDTGSFILIDPDTNNTVAGGMITESVSNVTQLESTDMSVVVLPTHILRQLEQTDLFKENESLIKQLQFNPTDLTAT